MRRAPIILYKWLRQYGRTSQWLNSPQPSEKNTAADRAFCADPLAKSPCSSAAPCGFSYRISFRFPSVSFSFSGRPLLHGSSHKSTAAKSSLKIRTKLSFLFPRGVSHAIGLSAVTAPFKPPWTQRFCLFPVDFCKITYSELHFHRPVPLLPLARKRQNISHGGNLKWKC